MIVISAIRLLLEFISHRSMCSMIWSKKIFWGCRNCGFSFVLVWNWRYFSVHIFSFQISKWYVVIVISAIRLLLEFISYRSMCSRICSENIFWWCRNCCFSSELVEIGDIFELTVSVSDLKVICSDRDLSYSYTLGIHIIQIHVLNDLE